MPWVSSWILQVAAATGAPFVSIYLALDEAIENYSEPTTGKGSCQTIVWVKL